MPHEQDPLPGTNLGRYRIVSKLGQGGMGVVYHAIQEPLELDVALKLPLPEAIADPAARDALLLEARTAARLKHPNICSILDVGEADGRVYVSMEFIEGRTLAERIPPLGLPDESVVLWGARIARALAHAHERGVIHRDVRPANVMLTPDGTPKLLDFGLSRRVVDAALGRPALGSGDAIVGVPPYLSPELISGEGDGAASDLWAMGVLLYEMCAGRPPFTAQSPSGLTKSILLAEAPALPEHVGRGLQAVVMRCLAKDPARRFQSAAELAAALETLAPDARSRRLRWLTSAQWVIGAGLAGYLVAAWYWHLPPFHPPGPKGQLVVAPMEVRGQMHGADFAGRAFSEALALNLAQGSRLHVTPVPSPAELPAGRSARQFATGRSAAQLVTGSITRVDDSVRVSISLVDVAKNEVLWGEDRTVRADDLPLLAPAFARGIAAELGAGKLARYDYFMYDTGPAEMATAPELSEALGALRRYEAPAALDATRRLVARFPKQPHARVLRVVAMFIDARYEPPGTPKAMALEAQLDTLHALDSRSPWYDAVRALRMMPGDTRSLATMSGVLARPDLTPAARAAVLSSRADLFGRGFRDSVAALADADSAVRLDPASDLALSTLARWLANRHRYPEAEERVKQAIALNPTVANYWHQLANVMLKQGRWREFIADLDQAAKLSTTADVVLSARSDGLACLGRWDEAAAAAKAAYGHRADPRYMLQYALCVMRLGQWEGAAAVLRPACAGGAEPACALADGADAVRLASGNAAGAKAAAAKAEAGMSAPNAKSVTYALAAYHARRGERDAALTELEKFVAQRWAEPGLSTDPNFAALRGEPRFRALAKQMEAVPIDAVFDSWPRSR